MKKLQIAKNKFLIRLWEEDQLLYIDSETGEVVNKITYFKEKTQRTEDLHWRYFAGCKSSMEVFAVKKHMDNFFKLHDVTEEDIDYQEFIEEYGRALSSHFPLNHNRGSSDWILDAYERCLIDNIKPSSIWFEYEKRAVITKDIVPSKEDLIKIQRLLKYKEGWIWHKMQELSM